MGTHSPVQLCSGFDNPEGETQGAVLVLTIKILTTGLYRCRILKALFETGQGQVFYAMNVSRILLSGTRS